MSDRPPGRDVLRYAGVGVPAFVEMWDGSVVSASAATPEQLTEAALLCEAMARAHQEEADTIRRLAEERKAA